MASLNAGSTTKSIFLPLFSLKDYYFIKADFEKLHGETEKAFQNKYKIVMTRNNKLNVVKLRHAVVIHLQFMIKWQYELNRARIKLDEREAIRFRPLHLHEDTVKWENPTPETVRKIAQYVVDIIEAVKNILIIAKSRLPFLLSYEDCRCLMFPK